MSRRRRSLVVLNPTAGGGAAQRVWPELAAALEQELPGYRLSVSRRPGMITQVVRRALRGGAERVVTVGGDGTVNEAVNGFMDGRGRPIRPEAVLAILPSGTGGDGIRSLGIPRQPLAALAAWRQAEPFAVDLGHVECRSPRGGRRRRFFLNVASFGLSGLVVARVGAMPKQLGGTVAFLGASLTSMLTYRNRSVRLRLDGGEWYEQRLLLAAVANGRFFGGGMEIAPAADMTDGQFEVVVLGNLALPEVLLSMPLIYRGRHLGHRKARSFTARRVEATSRQAVLIDSDGEQPGLLPASFELHPKALRLLI